MITGTITGKAQAAQRRHDHALAAIRLEEDEGWAQLRYEVGAMAAQARAEVTAMLVRARSEADARAARARAEVSAVLIENGMPARSAEAAPVGGRWVYDEATGEWHDVHPPTSQEILAPLAAGAESWRRRWLNKVKPRP